MEDNIIQMDGIWEDIEQEWMLEKVNPEDKSEVDGQHVLGRVKGPFFVPDGTSLNKRFYPKALWERVVSDSKVVQRLSDRTMFGCIGHKDRPVVEEDIADGKVSHIMTKLWIEDGHGMGEALILGTPAGKNLHTCLKAGSKMKTSSRAFGQFVKGRKAEGVPVVDEKTYKLETFDFVLNPGFKAASPAMVEQKKETGSMDEATSKTIETLSASRDRLQDELVSAVSKASKLEVENTALKEKAEALEKGQELIAEVRAEGLDVASVQSFSKMLSDKGIVSLTAFTEVISAVEFSNVEALKEFDGDITVVIDEHKKYQELGSLESLDEVLEEAKTALEGYSEFGSPQELDEVLDVAIDVLSSYTGLGSVSELQELVEKFDEFVKEQEDVQLDGIAEQLSKQFGKPVDSIKAMLEKMGEEGTKTALESFSEDFVPENTDDPGEDPIEDPKPGAGSKSRASSIMEKFMPVE